MDSMLKSEDQLRILNFEITNSGGYLNPDLRNSKLDLAFRLQNSAFLTSSLTEKY
jgi:hypothetical protein